MTVGTIETSILTDIANAIRFQAGVATLYKPREMAAAVTALDGTNAGNYQAQQYKQLQSGVLSDSVFSDIADAIRGQNGLSTLYQPGDMAAAILALTWDVGLKPRAVLSSTGVLEFNYVDRRRIVSGGIPIDAWEVSTTGYSSAGARPWDSVKLQVKKVVIDSSFGTLGITNCSYWFSGFTELVEVSGFENLSGITNAQQLFSSCASLETIYATSYTNAITSGSSMFYGCSKLVGGTDGFVPTNTSAGSVCKLGTGGVLTNPNADIRAWCKVFVYDDGYVEFTAAGSADAQKTLLASGRLCVNAKYKAAGIIPGYSYRAQFRTVVFRSDMGTFSEINMNYWFYSLTAITSFVGIGNLANVHEMQFAFSSCQGVTELDFTGFDPSHLTNLYYCFGGCNALTTIYADSTWALPSSGVSGTQVFYNCQNLVGENGTVWASSNVGYSYFRIDRAGQAGYLTAA